MTTDDNAAGVTTLPWSASPAPEQSHAQPRPNPPLHPPPPPPAAASVGGSHHLLWFASSVLLTTALVGLWRNGGIATRIVVGALNLLIAPANVLLAVSFLVEGVGFNLAFFAHAD